MKVGELFRLGIERFRRARRTMPEETAPPSTRDAILAQMRLGKFTSPSGTETLLTVENKPFPSPIEFVREVVTNISYYYLQGVYTMLSQNPRAEGTLIRKTLRCPFKIRGATLFLLEEGRDISFHLVSMDKKDYFDLQFILRDGNYFIDTETNETLADVMENAQRYGGEWGGQGYWES